MFGLPDVWLGEKCYHRLIVYSRLGGLRLTHLSGFISARTTIDRSRYVRQLMISQHISFAVAKRSHWQSIFPEKKSNNNNADANELRTKKKKHKNEDKR